MKRLLITAVAASLVLIGATSSTPAHADPVAPEVVSYAARNANRVCIVLAAFPNFAGVTGVMDGIQKDTGFTSMQTAQALVLSVDTTCPEFLPLLKRFADTYSPTTSAAGVTV